MACALAGDDEQLLELRACFGQRRLRPNPQVRAAAIPTVTLALRESQCTPDGVLTVVASLLFAAYDRV